jgi:hypothetical protein
MYLVSLVLLCCVGCGPPRLTGTAGDSSSTDISSTDSSSTDGNSTDASSTDANSTDGNSTDASSTDDGSETSDTLNFVPIGDLIGLLECDPFEQDCPHGEKCVPYASTGSWWDANRCVPVLGSQAVGAQCTFTNIVEANDDCDETSFCWNATEMEGEMVGTCHGLCTGSLEMPECPDGHHCLLSSDSVVTLCFPQCDPITQDCVDGIACYWSGSAFICTQTLELPGTPPGQPCGWVNDCEAGSLCVDTSLMPDCLGSGCCASFCDLGLGDAQCAAVPGTTCVPFWEQGMAPADLEHVGICVLGP